ncbi:5-dehydro-2-deoxygluconokinase [Marinomonas sp. S3726]|uniref:bifunctional 5-dehydro-2-deoxygluconokinase/5-dehydro-2- deoxyphosphogluconate aldolase n=1 Tax=Marinomonas sp. S3726 TaxID=579484 RepID=UPI0005FA544F|nr:5-dehydro-2-deoxygluconokinase [Marinomonas sp. S3726]KJZ12473.1 5-dehydro-2-deoxygluconokinase [Marinomonas sp. S3726]
MKDKTLDVICLGRAAVDLYSEQIGSALEDANSFKKYLGGSSANIAFGTARMGLKSAMLTRVGDEHMGRFVRNELARAGVDVSHVITDEERLTGLVLLGIKDKDTFPLIFYRENCADMAISETDFNEDYIASAKALLITGTHFSTQSTNKTALKAIEYARANNTKVVVDIDYRPVLWGLTGRGEGENRFVSNESVTEHLLSIMPLCDLVVGTEEEFHIAGGSEDTIECLKRIRKVSDAEFVVKRGALGCSVFKGDIPQTLDEGITCYGVKVDVLNVLGAGDAFLSGYLRGWIKGEITEKSCDYANASGAIVVSRHGCAPAMPSLEELDHYLANRSDIPRPDLNPVLNYLHRVTTQRNPKEWQDLCILAFDHRRQFVDMCRELGASLDKIPQAKQLILEATYQGAHELDGKVGGTGILADGTFAQDVLNDITGKDYWIARPVELPSSRPLRFDQGNNVAQEIATWPANHIVKCLVFFHPDDEVNLRNEQEQKVMDLYQACCETGHELLLEIIPPVGSLVNDETLSRSIERFYNLGIFPDWWKLPSPSESAWKNISKVIKQRSPYCRGVVLLGLDAPVNELQAGFNAAAGQDICKGFAIGRTIFSEPTKAWLSGNLDDTQYVQEVKSNYLTMSQLWQQRHQGEPS